MKSTATVPISTPVSSYFSMVTWVAQSPVCSPAGTVKMPVSWIDVHARRLDEPDAGFEPGRQAVFERGEVRVHGRDEEARTRLRHGNDRGEGAHRGRRSVGKVNQGSHQVAHASAVVRVVEQQVDAAAARDVGFPRLS